MFHKEGFKIITVTFLIFAALSILVHFKIENDILQKGLFLVLLILVVLILQFFRNPKRNFTLNPEQVLSPVDGKVVVIEEVYEKEYFNDKRL